MILRLFLQRLLLPLKPACLPALFSLLCLAPLPCLAQLDEMAALMILEGSVLPTDDGKLSPTEGDTLIAYNAAGKELARTSVGAGASYSGLVITLSLADNGKPITLLYQKGNTLYRTFAGKEGDATFNFAGSAFPVRTKLEVLLRRSVFSQGDDDSSGNGGNGGGNNNGGGNGNGNNNGGGVTPTPPAARTGDVNGDGKVDETDLRILRDALTGRIPIVLKKMDVNQDGVFNTRDVIMVLQTIRSARRLPGAASSTSSTASGEGAGEGSGLGSAAVSAHRLQQGNIGSSNGLGSAAVQSVRPHK